MVSRRRQEYRVRSGGFGVARALDEVAGAGCFCRDRDCGRDRECIAGIAGQPGLTHTVSDSYRDLLAGLGPTPAAGD